MKYLIGLDLGTTNIKAVLFDVEGNELFVSSAPTEVVSSNNTWNEQDMIQVWETAADCLKGVMDSGIAKAEDVLALSLSGQGEGVWMIDAAGNPIKKASLWNDGRAASVIDAMTPEQLEIYARVAGSDPTVSNTMTQIKWYHDNQPEVFEKAATIFHCKDWVRFKLTGERHTDFCDTSVSQLDVVNDVPAAELYKAMGIEQYMKLIPDPIRSYEKAGEITAQAAARTGLKAGTPVAAGALDVAITMVGVNAVNAGDIYAILGTTCCTGIVMDKSDVDTSKNGQCIVIHPQKGLNINIKATMAGTPNLDWALENISDTKDFAVIEEKLPTIPAGSHGLIYHPYITPSGERVPFYNPNARASFFGLSTYNDRYDMIKAVYEGIAFTIKDCLYGFDRPGKISLAGGGAKSPAWAQIIADVTGREVVVYDGTEFGAKGAAVLAGVCAGIYTDINEAAAKLCKVKASYQPDAKNAEIYDELYKVFRAVRLSNMETWNMRQEIVERFGLN